MTPYLPSYRPAKPGKVTKLNPEFARLVQGPVRKPRAIARIERTAQLTYFTSTTPGSAEAGR
jgi:hypothetical protein